MPQNERKLKYYDDPVPLFNRYQIESQIESAFQREVRLPSGGALVIDHTEALVSIDINSARATKGSDIEETATNTNLEAADEVARQLRLRDLGGLVVIDFIDMFSSKHQRQVENRLREALRADRARVQIGKISKFGLLEMSRQRLRPSLGEGSGTVCPRCQGHGTIRGIESTALSILRLVEEEARKDNTGRVVADVPVDVATYLLNEKRQSISEIEARNETMLLIVANPTLDTPNYTIERIRMTEADHEALQKKSYELATNNDDHYAPPDPREVKPTEAAAVGMLSPDMPPPQRAAVAITAESAPVTAQEPPGGIRRIFGKVSSLFGTAPVAAPAAEAATAEQDATTSDRKSAHGKAGPGSRRDEGDGKRRSRGGRNRGGRNRNKNRDGEEVRADGQQERAGRGNGRSGTRQAESKAGEQKKADAAVANGTSEAVDATAENAGSTEGSTRKRSRRGGRGRKRNNAVSAEATTDAVNTEGVTNESGEQNTGQDISPAAVSSAADAVTNGPESGPDSETADGETPKRSRSRGRRGGRGRGRGRGRTDESANATNDENLPENNTDHSGPSGGSDVNDLAAVAQNNTVQGQAHLDKAALAASAAAAVSGPPKASDVSASTASTATNAGETQAANSDEHISAPAHAVTPDDDRPEVVWSAEPAEPEATTKTSAAEAVEESLAGDVTPAESIDESVTAPVADETLAEAAPEPQAEPKPETKADPVTRTRGFIQCDVFSSVATRGNALAVVLDGEGLDTETMQAFSAWTNLAETTFVLPPTEPQADYRLRIFTPQREMRFAGHPTLGSCAAWLKAGGQAKDPRTIRQQCDVGIVEIDTTGRVPAFIAPPTRIMPAEADYEVRMLAPSSGMIEDPITGSLNAALAHWMLSRGQLPTDIVVAQGRCLGREGRVFIAPDPTVNGRVRIGGETSILIEGTVQL